MAMQTPQPAVHVFKEINVGKFKSVKHYELVESDNISLLSNQINISIDRNYAQSMPVYWLKIKENNKWSSCITGLFKTCESNIFKGDVNNKKHLLLFKFSNLSDTLTVYYYQNYFTKDVANLFSLITN